MDQELSDSLKGLSNDFSLSLPKSEEDLESLRQELRQLCLENLYFLGKAILGYSKLNTELHQEVTELLQQRTCPRHPEGCQNKIIVLPRGHLKTTICTKLYAIWRYLRNHEIRILLVNETATNAEHFLREIKGHFERNVLFRWLFPEAIPDTTKTKWTDNEILLPREGNFSEGTIETIGVGGAITSRHYDLIIFDDLVGLEAMYNPEMMTRAIDWYKIATGLLISPRTGEMLIVGTRWAFSDVVSHILDNEPSYDRVVRAAIEQGEPIWPSEFPQTVLDDILDRQGPKIFSCQYMNDPTEQNPASFEESWQRIYIVIPVALVKVTTCDPAIGETAQSDYSAILTQGMDHTRAIYLLELSYDRFGVDEMIEEMCRHWMVHRPSVLGLETIFFQKVLLWPLREAMRRLDITMNVKSMPQLAIKNRTARIAAMHPYFARGQYFFPRTGIAPLLKEYREFPAGKHEHALQALAMGVQLLNAPEGLDAPAEDPLSYEALKKEIEAIHFAKPSGIWTWHKEVRA